jgi:hypothetical protein
VSLLGEVSSGGDYSLSNSDHCALLVFVFRSRLRSWQRRLSVARSSGILRRSFASARVRIVSRGVFRYAAVASVFVRVDSIVPCGVCESRVGIARVTARNT